MHAEGYCSIACDMTWLLTVVSKVLEIFFFWAFAGHMIWTETNRYDVYSNCSVYLHVFRCWLTKVFKWQDAPATLQLTNI